MQFDIITNPLGGGSVTLEGTKTSYSKSQLHTRAAGDVVMLVGVGSEEIHYRITTEDDVTVDSAPVAQTADAVFAALSVIFFLSRGGGGTATTPAQVNALIATAKSFQQKVRPDAQANTPPSAADFPSPTADDVFEAVYQPSGRREIWQHTGAAWPAAPEHIDVPATAVGEATYTLETTAANAATAPTLADVQAVPEYAATTVLNDRDNIVRLIDDGREQRFEAVAGVAVPMTVQPASSGGGNTNTSLANLNTVTTADGTTATITTGAGKGMIFDRVGGAWVYRNVPKKVRLTTALITAEINEVGAVLGVGEAYSYETDLADFVVSSDGGGGGNQDETAKSPGGGGETLDQTLTLGNTATNDIEFAATFGTIFQDEVDGNKYRISMRNGALETDIVP